MNRRRFTAAVMAILVSHSAAADDEQEALARRCTRLRQRIAALRLRLRTGYSAAQGRVWRTQLAELEREYRQQCR